MAKDNEGLVMKYFVLNPNKDDYYGEASRQAILTYAGVINHTNPVLARELRAWVEEIRKRIMT